VAGGADVDGTSRTDVRGPASVTSRSTSPSAVTSRPNGIVRDDGSATLRSSRTPMSAGMPAMSAAVIDPIASGDTITSSRRGGGENSRAHEQQRDVLDQVTADGRETRRPEKPERREWKPLRAPLHEEMNEQWRRDQDERDERERIQPHHGRLTPAAPAGNCEARDRAAYRSRRASTETPPRPRACACA